MVDLAAVVRKTTGLADVLREAPRPLASFAVVEPIVTIVENMSGAT